MDIETKGVEPMGRQSGLDASQRVEIVLMMLRKDEPIATLARRYNVSETTLHRWRDEFLAGGQTALADRRSKQADGQTAEIARLKEPGVWESMLDIKPPRIVLLNWPRFYDAAVGLLRSIEKARPKSLPPDGPVVSGLVREASAEAQASTESEPSTAPATLQDFRLLLTNLP